MKEKIIGVWARFERCFDDHSENSFEGSYIPKRFRYKILTHIIKNNLSKIETPLILCIQGPPGDGKTFQSKEVCKEAGIKVTSLSGSSLSGQYEKDSINVLKEAYIRSSFIKEIDKILPVILIDDFDLSVASTSENTRNTVNTQLLNGFLMNLCDNPTACEGQQTHRIPIIITGNNFTTLYAPMRRHGRVDIFEWEPNTEEKIKMVSHIYGRWLKQSELRKIRQFVENYKEQPVAFFSSLISDVIDIKIFEILNQSHGVKISLPLIQNTINNINEIALEQLQDVAILRQQSVVKKYV